MVNTTALKKSIFILFLSLSFYSKAQKNYTQFVNPAIGTGGHGHTFPGATLPFAMVQLSPDTRIDGSWDGCSGYHYSDTLIYGFSHTHLSGTGCSDYGDIAFVPSLQTNEKGMVSSIKKFDNSGKSFSHKNEISKAGYYSVKLDNGIKVELTSTLRVGIQQYTYSQNGYALITLNLKHRDELLEGKITQINKHTFSGLRRSKAWAENQLVFFYFELSRDADDITISKNEKGETELNLGYKVKIGEKISIKTALSSTDESGAKANLMAELNHWNFEKVKQDANKAWNKELNKINVYGGSKAENINFYSALYHCMIHPNIMNDVDGRYMGRDKQIHKADSFNYYTVFSLWDTYRALHPLLNLIDKKRSHDFIKTFQVQYEQSGRLPMWELWGNETNCMIGFHSVSVILDAYNKGVITLEELKAIYPAVKAEAMSNRYGMDKFREKGFLSIEDESESVSKTLEYSYDFYCVSQIAMKLYNYKDAKYFENLSEGWQNVYNVQTGFMTPRKNGGWLTPFDPKRVDNNYTEANAWQYSFAVPHEYWELSNKVSELFNADSKTTGRDQSDITGMIGQYAQGNEPSHHIPYMFRNLDSTAKYVKKICRELYKPTPDGLCGNEDCGQMSAWYVFSAMGIYPMQPYRPSFQFGTMLFDSVKIKSDNYSFHIYKDKNKILKDKKLIAKMEQDGYFFTDSEDTYIGKDKQMVIIGLEAVTEQLATNEMNYFFAAPIISQSSQLIKDSLKIELISNCKNEYDDRQFIYKINDEPFKTYAQPFYISKNSKIKAIELLDMGKMKKEKTYFNNPTYRCDTAFAHFYKKPNNYTIKINSTYSKQYDADGDEGLIDGQLGETDWRKGRWQGYQGQDFEAIVDLQVETKITNIKAGFLRDSRSWILFPTTVYYYGSHDGIVFTKIGLSQNLFEDKSNEVQRKECEIDRLSETFRYIKIKAINYGKLPDWHQGAGGDAYIFIDEIIID